MSVGLPRKRALNLRAGELVEVRSLPEILTTLDGQGRLDGVPFMPEMLQFSGKRFRVAKQVDRTCDRATKTGLRLLTESVILEDVRCDGAFHGGCEAGCTLLLKEAWLRRVDGLQGSSPSPNGKTADSAEQLPQDHAIFTNVRQLDPANPESPVYSCQATDVLKFTKPYDGNDARHYWHDLSFGNVGPLTALRVLTIAAFNNFQRRRGGVTFPHIFGTLTKTPTESLDLNPGDLVRVKSREEILSTLDVGECNRGLSFDKEMAPFCGGTYKVRRNVKKIIDESSGKLVAMKRDCIILEGAECQGLYHQLCPRALYPFWREIWLTRVTATDRILRPSGEGSFVAFLIARVLKATAARIGRALRWRSVPTDAASA